MVVMGTQPSRGSSYGPVWSRDEHSERRDKRHKPQPVHRREGGQLRLDLKLWSRTKEGSSNMFRTWPLTSLKHPFTEVHGEETSAYFSEDLRSSPEPWNYILTRFVRFQVRLTDDFLPAQRDHRSFTETTHQHSLSWKIHFWSWLF